MAESWSARARRLDRERRRREEERRRRKMRQALSAEAYLRMARRAARRHLRQLTAAQRRKLKRELRKRKYAATKKMFGQCPTCGRANGPGHTCRIRFGEHGAARLRARMDKRGQSDYPDLWRGKKAA